MANPSASTVIGLARNLLKTESTSEAPVMADSFMLAALSDANLKWARAFRRDGSQPIVFQRETGVDLKPETAINAAAGTLIGATSITVDAQTFTDAAGVAVVWDNGIPDIFEYAAQTSTSFTGVSGLSFAHEDDDVIAPLYKLPSNFGSFRKAPNYGDGVYVGGPLQFTGGPPLPGYFSIYDDGTSKYLWLSRQATGTASVWYDKASTVIDELTDTVDVPTEFQFFLVWHLVAFGLMGREQDINAMFAAQGASEKLLQEALEDRNIHKKIRTRSFSRSSSDYFTHNGRVYSI